MRDYLKCIHEADDEEKKSAMLARPHGTRTTLHRYATAFLRFFPPCFLLAASSSCLLRVIAGTCSRLMAAAGNVVPLLLVPGALGRAALASAALTLHAIACFSCARFGCACLSCARP